MDYIDSLLTTAMKKDDASPLALPDTSGNPEALSLPPHDQAVFEPAFWRVIANFRGGLTLVLYHLTTLLLYSFSWSLQSIQPPPAY